MRRIFFQTFVAVAGLWLTGCGSCPCRAKGAAFDIAGASEAQLAGRYDVLADEILRVEKEELDIMRALLRIYKGQADAALTAAKAAPAAGQEKPLETAIEAVTKIALEGDKAVNDTKLKLRKGGHHHSKAEEEGEAEYILVDPKSKAALMDGAKKLRELLAGVKGGTAAPAADLDAIGKSVDELADKAIATQKT